MANAHLQKAMAELRAADAQGLPSEAVVEAAILGKDVTRWTGKKGNGDQWELVKNTADSFNCMC